MGTGTTQLIPLLDAIPRIRGVRGRPRNRPRRLFADRGYDYDKYLAVRQTHSVLANGPARHERYSFGVSQATVLAPHTGYSVRVYPAIRVTAGTVTINQWITDTDLIAITR